MFWWSNGKRGVILFKTRIVFLCLFSDPFSEFMLGTVGQFPETSLSFWRLCLGYSLSDRSWGLPTYSVAPPLPIWLNYWFAPRLYSLLFLFWRVRHLRSMRRCCSIGSLVSRDAFQASREGCNTRCDWLEVSMTDLVVGLCWLVDSRSLSE